MEKWDWRCWPADWVVSPRNFEPHQKNLWRFDHDELAFEHTGFHHRVFSSAYYCRALYLFADTTHTLSFSTTILSND